MKPHRHIETFQPYRVKSKILKCDCGEKYIITQKHLDHNITTCLECYAIKFRDHEKQTG